MLTLDGDHVVRSLAGSFRVVTLLNPVDLGACSYVGPPYLDLDWAFASCGWAPQHNDLVKEAAQSQDRQSDEACRAVLGGHSEQRCPVHLSTYLCLKINRGLGGGLK
jgi:hypothetical protein